ncbi:ATP-binding cassette domain-containing protein [Lachnospiraceae bacterium 46-15]
MSEKIIEVINVTKTFGSQKALNQVSVTFGSGKIYGIIGRNGSGKTVLFKCICGFLKITQGKIIINGKEISKKCEIPSNIGIIIETPGFLPNLSGYRNLKLLSLVSGTFDKSRIAEVMKMVDLDVKSKKHVSKYSLGMRQRLGIAQAILENPDILILDEPMNGLDAQGVEDMRKLFIKMREEGKTILLASHNAEDIAFLCDAVYRLDDGVMEYVEREGV